MHNTSTIEVDGLQQQQTTSSSILISQEQESDAIMVHTPYKWTDEHWEKTRWCLLASLDESVPMTTSDSCSGLTRVESNVICCCSRSTSRSDVELCWTLKYIFGYKECLHELLYHIQINEVSSDLSYWGASTHRTVTHSIFLCTL